MCGPPRARGNADGGMIGGRGHGRRHDRGAQLQRQLPRCSWAMLCCAMFSDVVVTPCAAVALDPKLIPLCLRQADGKDFGVGIESLEQGGKQYQYKIVEVPDDSSQEPAWALPPTDYQNWDPFATKIELHQKVCSPPEPCPSSSAFLGSFAGSNTEGTGLGTAWTNAPGATGKETVIVTGLDIETQRTCSQHKMVYTLGHDETQTLELQVCCWVSGSDSTSPLLPLPPLEKLPCLLEAEHGDYGDQIEDVVYFNQGDPMWQQHRFQVRESTSVASRGTGDAWWSGINVVHLRHYCSSYSGLCPTPVNGWLSSADHGKIFVWLKNGANSATECCDNGQVRVSGLGLVDQRTCAAHRMKGVYASGFQSLELQVCCAGARNAAQSAVQSLPLFVAVTDAKTEAEKFLAEAQSASTAEAAEAAASSAETSAAQAKLQAANALSTDAIANAAHDLRNAKDQQFPYKNNELGIPSPGADPIPIAGPTFRAWRVVGTPAPNALDHNSANDFVWFSSFPQLLLIEEVTAATVAAVNARAAATAKAAAAGTAAAAASPAASTPATPTPASPTPATPTPATPTPATPTPATPTPATPTPATPTPSPAPANATIITESDDDDDDKTVFIVIAVVGVALVFGGIVYVCTLSNSLDTHNVRVRAPVLLEHQHRMQGGMQGNYGHPGPGMKGKGRKGGLGMKGKKGGLGMKGKGKKGGL